MIAGIVNVIVGNLLTITLVLFILYFGYELIRGRGEIEKEDKKLK